MLVEGSAKTTTSACGRPRNKSASRADLLDRLVNYAGEVAIYRARLEQQLAAFRATAQEMERTNIRLRDQLRRLDAETEAQIIARYQRESEAGSKPSTRWSSTASATCSSCRAASPSPPPTCRACTSRWTT